MDPALYAPLENKPLARSESLEIDDLLSRASREQREVMHYMYKI